MITPEMLAFIKEEQGKGVSKESIVTLLKTQNWDNTDITEAFNFIEAQVQNHTNFIPTAYSYSAPQTKSHKFFKITLLILLFVVIIIGGALAYASGYIVPLDKIFSQSVQSSHPNTTVALNFDMTIDASGLKGEAANMSKSLPGLSPLFTIKSKGVVDTIDKNDPKSDLSLSLTSGTLEAAMDVKSLNSLVYMEFTKAPDIGFISLKPIENKWVIVPKSGSDSITGNPLVATSGFNSQFLNTLTDDQKQHIVDMTNKASFIKVTNKHLPQIVGGATSFHFDFDLDRTGILTYLKDLVTYMNSINPDSSKIPPITDTDYNKISDAIENFHGEVWIGVFDHLPHKILVNFDVVNPDKPEDGSIKFMTTLMYSDWNKPVVIEAPKDAVTIEQLMSSVMGGMLGGLPAVESGGTTSTTSPDSLANARAKASDATIESTLANMRAQAELYYDVTNTVDSAGSYKGFCASHGQNGAYVLAAKLPSNTIYKCNDSTQEWAAWAKLSMGDYWCVDSRGFSKNMNTLPKGTVCQ